MRLDRDNNKSATVLRKAIVPGIQSIVVCCVAKFREGIQNTKQHRHVLSVVQRLDVLKKYYARLVFQTIHH